MCGRFALGLQVGFGKGGHAFHSEENCIATRNSCIVWVSPAKRRCLDRGRQLCGSSNTRRFCFGRLTVLWQPRYNIAPNTQAPVIRQQDAGQSSSGPESSPGSLVMHTMRWGIKYGKDGGSRAPQAINARSENLIEGVGMWNKFRGKNRCIVICQGYPVHSILLVKFTN